MKKIIIICVFCLIAATAWAGSYRVTLIETTDNVYEIFELPGWSIVTNWCYQYAYLDNAILEYTPYGNNKIIFSNGQSCTVDYIQVCEKIK